MINSAEGQEVLTNKHTAYSGLLLLLYHLSGTLACYQVHFGDPQLNNIACQCNSTHCDSLDFEWPANEHAYLWLKSDKSGARFEQKHVRQADHEQVAATQVDYEADVELNKRAQQVLGYGGAFTDSATMLLRSLPEQVQSHALQDYFSPRGLDYNMGRVPIGGTDMSSRPYSYDDLPDGQEDFELRRFRLQAEDLQFKIPMIRRANRMRAQSGNRPPLKLLAASWSAPAWMKSNRNLVQGRLIGNSSSGAYYDAYARYVVRFLNEYEHQHGIRIWALSPQNEPHTPKRVGPIKINFNSVNFEPHEMADYLENSLVPNLIKANKSAEELKLFLWDDTLDGVQEYQASALASGPNVRNYTFGLALHWYSQGLREMPYRYLYDARRSLPAQYCLISTEASFIGKPRPGSWERGQRYAVDVIQHLRAGSLAWIDWNLALNISGGPTWNNNLLDSAILVDLERRLYLKNPMYYALGHISRFIQPGSHVLYSSVERRGWQSSNMKQQADQSTELEVVAAELAQVGEQGGRRVAVVLLNKAAQSRRVRLNLRDCIARQSQPALELELSASSLNSFAFLC